MIRICVAIFLLMALADGCVERTMTLQTNPPGALVYVNDQEAGRTPVTRDFNWYGVYDVVVRKDGYEPIKTSATIMAPLYEWVPFDLFAELSPIKFKDHRDLSYDLTPQPVATQQTRAELLDAERMKAQLQSSVYTTSRPTTARSR